MFMNSLKGKFGMCPTELIHPKRASFKDNIISMHCNKNSKLHQMQAKVRFMIQNVHSTKSCCLH